MKNNENPFQTTPKTSSSSSYLGFIDVDSVERFDDFRRRKSPKIGAENRQIDANRGRKSPKIAKNHAQMMQIIPNFWKGSQLCMTLFQGDYFGLCSYYFFLLLLKSSIGP